MTEEDKILLRRIFPYITYRRFASKRFYMNGKYNSWDSLYEFNMEYLNWFRKDLFYIYKWLKSDKIFNWRMVENFNNSKMVSRPYLIANKKQRRLRYRVLRSSSSPMVELYCMDYYCCYFFVKELKRLIPLLKIEKLNDLFK